MLFVHDEPKFLSKCRLLAYVIPLIFLADGLAWAQSVGGIISRIGDTTHLELRGRKEWLYTSPVKEKGRIVAQLPAFDDATVVQLQAWTCPLIKEIKVNKSAPDGKYEVEFYLASENVESFDYLTDDPSYLVVDFYEQKPPVASTATPETTVSKIAPKSDQYKKSPKRKSRKNLAKSSEYKKVERSPASSELLTINDPSSRIQTSDLAEDEFSSLIQYESGVFDGGDPNYDRFRIKNYEKKEESLIASQQNIYLRYPMLLQRLRRLDDLKKDSPVYEIKEKDTEENKVARLLLTLFQKKRFGAFMKTMTYFEKKFANSAYAEILKNVKAQVHMQLYDRDQNPVDLEAFQSLYTYLIDTYPDSVLTERNSLLLLYSHLEKDNGAQALQHAQKFLLKFPQSKEKHLVQFAQAEAYLTLNKPLDAIRVYNEIITAGEDKTVIIEAFYRMGDIYAEKQDYSEAIDAYKKAQSAYPEFKNLYANAQYNKSESLFWLGKNAESLDNYIEFLKLFPNSDHGGYALTRIGEILEILGADQRNVMGAFIEGYFRFPKSPGSEVARIRMLSRGLKGMQEREMNRAIAEIDEIAGNSKLPKIDEFATLMKADGYSRRKESKASLDLLLNYYQSHPTTANQKTFRGRILRNISDIMKADLETDKFISALNIHGKYSTTWLKNGDRVDIPFYQAYAYEKAGVPNEAEKIYKTVLNRLEEIKGKTQDKERKVYENSISTDQVQLRLAAVALANKRYRDSYGYLNMIKDKMELPLEIEKAQIGANVAEHLGDTRKSIQFLENLIANYKDNSDLMVGPKLQLAEIYINTRNWQAADDNLIFVEDLKVKDSSFKDEHWAKTLELRADYQNKNGQKLASVETYVKLLDSFESAYPLSSVRYKAGHILFDEGDIKGAEKIWSGLTDQAGGVYKKLAEEKLAQAQWSDNYRKYVERIPAAESLK